MTTPARLRDKARQAEPKGVNQFDEIAWARAHVAHAYAHAMPTIHEVRA